MRARVLLFAFLALSVSAGCSNHPLQDDVTGYDTNDIVQKLRCEAKKAVSAEIDFQRLRADQVSVKAKSEELKRYTLWESNNKETLEKVDKAVADDEAAEKELKRRQGELLVAGFALDVEFNVV